MRSIDREVQSVAAQVEGVVSIEPEALTPLLARLIEHHLKDEDHVWWWEALNEVSQRHHYGTGGDPLTAWDGLIPVTEHEVFLVVTDDDLPPWSGLRGEVEALKEVLRELHVFEYFLFNQSADWVLFDTHHNELILSVNQG